MLRMPLAVRNDLAAIGKLRNFQFERASAFNIF
jgi:hypothetical protein